MSDLISRNVLILHLNDWALSVSDNDKEYEDVQAFIKCVEEWPSAEPEFKELQNWKTEFKGFIDALVMPRDDYNGIMEYIDEVPSTNQWIKCSEKIPDKNVLCCDKTGEIMIGYIYKDGVESDTGYSAENEREFMYDCIAWMPLPQYESEDKE